MLALDLHLELDMMEKYHWKDAEWKVNIIGFVLQGTVSQSSVI